MYTTTNSTKFISAHWTGFWLKHGHSLSLFNTGSQMNLIHWYCSHSRVQTFQKWIQKWKWISLTVRKLLCKVFIKKNTFLFCSRSIKFNFDLFFKRKLFSTYSHFWWTISTIVHFYRLCIIDFCRYFMFSRFMTLGNKWNEKKVT